MMWWKRNGGRKMGQEEFAKNLADLPMFRVVSASPSVYDYLSIYKALSTHQLGDGVLYRVVT